MPVVTLVLDAAQLLAQRRGLGLVAGQGQGEDHLVGSYKLQVYYDSDYEVSFTSSGLKWQSDTERREHWGEASGRRRRIKEET